MEDWGVDVLRRTTGISQALLTAGVTTSLQSPACVNGTFPFCDIHTIFFEKLHLVAVISEYDGCIDTPHHYVMERSGCMQSRLSQHALSNIRLFLSWQDLCDIDINDPCACPEGRLVRQFRESYREVMECKNKGDVSLFGSIFVQRCCQ